MNKIKRNVLSIIIAFVLLFTLSGCTAKKDSENSYKMPLGDVSYICDIDLPLTGKIYNADGTVKTNYDVNEGNYTVTLSIEANNSKYDNKFLELVVGYYSQENRETATNLIEDSDDNFIPVCDKKTINLHYIKNDQGILQYSNETISFSLNNESIQYKDSLCLKIKAGSQVDKANNVSKSNLKNYRGSEFKINALTVNDGTNSYDILTYYTTIADEKKLPYYYNTATLSTSSDVLNVKLTSKTGLWQTIIEGCGILLYYVTKWTGGHYWLGLLIFTILLRTLGWPIYAKSNSATSGMSKLQPEMERINKKYEGRNDQNSQAKKAMEMKMLMKENKVSMFGCLLPFLQMPIFLAVYQTVSRFPLTPMYASKVDFSFFSTSFAFHYGESSGHWLLAILVGITMIGSQLVSTYMQKRIQKKHTTFYTANSAANQSNKTVFIMMAVMTVFMVVFAWNSSGISFYWIIGNVYQIGQTVITKLAEEKKEDRLALESGKPRGR